MPELHKTDASDSLNHSVTATTCSINASCYICNFPISFYSSCTVRLGPTQNLLLWRSYL